MFMWLKQLFVFPSGLAVTISKKPWRYPIERIRSRSIGLASNTWYSISLINLAPTKNDTFALVILPPSHMPPPPPLTHNTSLDFSPTGEYVEKNPCRYIDIAVKQECKDMQHLEKVFQDIVDKGGEGVILRDPLAPLQPGRCLGFLKHKVRQLLYKKRIIILIFFPNIEIQRRWSQNCGQWGPISMAMWIVRNNFFLYEFKVMWLLTRFLKKAQWGSVYCSRWHNRVCETMESSARRYSELQTSWVPACK